MNLTDDEKELLQEALAALAAKSLMNDNDHMDDYKDYQVGCYNVYGIIDQCKELAKKIKESES